MKDNKKNSTNKVQKNKFLLLEQTQEVPNKIFEGLKKQNSFFEDDPNFFYDYINKAELNIDHIKVDLDKLQLKKKNAKNDNIFQQQDVNFDKINFKLPDKDQELIEYKEHLSNYILLKKNIKNNQFLLRQESGERVKDLDGANNHAVKENNDDKNIMNNDIRNVNIDKSLYGNQQGKLNEEENLKQFLEINKQKASKQKELNVKQNLKMMQIYSQKEIQDYYKYKRKLHQIKNSLEKEDINEKPIEFTKDELLERAKMKTGILNNNTILFKPTIFKSKKQQHYEMDKENNIGNAHINALMRNKMNFKDLEENEIKFRLENFERKVREIEQRNYMNKLEKLDNLNLNVNENKAKLEKENLQIKKERNKVDVVEDSFEEEVEINKPQKEISLCEKIVNFFVGDPYKTYASKKHIWSGKDRPYGKYFQDTRIFGDIYDRQVIGKAHNKKKHNKKADGKDTIFENINDKSIND